MMLDFGLGKRPVDGQLVQLAYASTSTSGAGSALEMSDILAEARPRNAGLAITGVLTVVAGRFVQIIEGPADSVDSLLVLLRRDRRHSGLTIIERRTVTNRAFADWDMVSPRLAGLEVTQLALILSDDGFGLDDIIPVFNQAIARQETVLAGQAQPSSASSELPDAPVPAPRGVDGEL